MRLTVSLLALATLAVLSVDVYVVMADSKEESSERAVAKKTPQAEPEVKQPGPRREFSEPASRVRQRRERPEVVTVTSKDSLADIAEGFEGVTACDVYGVNQETIEDPDVIYSGQELEVPASDASPSEQTCPQMQQTAEPAPESPAEPEPEPEPVQPDTQSTSTGVWDRLAQCESGGDWSINTGNGFYGGLQFHPDTWARYGGHNFAPNAHQASRDQEIVIAERVLAREGWGAWPACSRKLGLR